MKQSCHSAEAAPSCIVRSYVMELKFSFIISQAWVFSSSLEECFGFAVLLSGSAFKCSDLHTACSYSAIHLSSSWTSFEKLRL